MEPILDALTASPNPQLFELDPPRYTSAFGRRTDAVFKSNVPPAPMIFSQDQGLVLYERVISTKAENQLLQKLTKPKYYHQAAMAPGAKKEDGGSTRRGAAHSSLATAQASARHVVPPPHAHQLQHTVATHHAAGPGTGTGTGNGGGGGRTYASAPTSRPGSAHAARSGGAGATGGGGALATGQRPQSSGRSQALASTPPAGAARDPEAGTRALAAATAAAAAPGSQPGGGGGGGGQRHQRSRSMSPGQAAAAARGAGGGHMSHRKPLYPEDGPLKDYFSKERASVTATTVFTWGNRYKIGSVGTGSGVSGALGAGGGGGGGGGKGGRGGSGGSGGSGGNGSEVAFTSYMPTQHKPPLRL